MRKLIIPLLLLLSLSGCFEGIREERRLRRYCIEQGGLYTNTGSFRGCIFTREGR